MSGSEIHLFNSDQLTGWQKNAFPVNRPAENARGGHGQLRTHPGSSGEEDYGDPVFFLKDDDENVTFFGRSLLFRLPYDRTPRDLIPCELRSSEGIDYAEALFGRAEPSPLAGRVHITDARTHETRPFVCGSDGIVPQILSSPKPTTFQHYLVQDSDDKKKLRHYGSNTPDETVIRGHKLYWHQGNRSLAQIEDPDVEDSSTQHTQMRPVSSGVGFRFRVYFENLSDAELGALCWTLYPQGDPEQDYCHKLGMGKPLGMGAVKLQATLHLNDRRERYASLFDGDGWADGFRYDEDDAPAEESFDPYVEKFERTVLDALPSPEAAAGEGQQAERLQDLPRIRALLKMMTWAGFSAAAEGGRYLAHEDRPNTRYMTLEEFRDRSVLPDPLSFPEPEEGEAPNPGAGRVFTGVVVSYSMEDNEGMIAPDDGSADVPVRAPNVEDLRDYPLPRQGQRVQFEIKDGSDGTPEAVNVRRT